MKKNVRLLALLLVAVSVLSVSTAALGAEEVTCYIPNRVERLALPDYSEAIADECNYKGDPFRTGQEGGDTFVTWEQVTVKGYKYVRVNGVKTKKSATYDTLYIAQVRTYFPKGNYIRKIVANYRNDAPHTLIDYLITYQVSDKEKYTVRYAASTVTMLETHTTTTVAGITFPKITFSKVDGQYASRKLSPTQYLHHYTKDQILEGWYDRDDLPTLKSGSGDNLNKWYLWEYWSGKVTQYKRGGLKPVTSFRSPRVE